VIRPKYGWRQFTDMVRLRITSPDILTADHLRSWVGQLHTRLEIGAEEYGDSSYQRTFMDLMEELTQENLDRAGWAYILWVKASAALDSGNLNADQTQYAKHIADMALSVAHRSFGAYCQDIESLLVACAGSDLDR
jgi:hypothetical protein